MRQGKLTVTRFSIVITCYNQRHFIDDAVNSALQQNPRLREIIVVDDGSSDASASLIQQYKGSIEFIQLRENIGPTEARNQGAARATGEYLVFLDGDDGLMPWALDVYDRLIIERKPKVILARSRWITGTMPEIAAEEFPRTIEFAEYRNLIRKDRSAGLSASAYIVDRRLFWSVGGWTPGIFQLDLQDLSTKLGFESVILIRSPRTVFYRIHEHNTILNVPPFVTNLYRLLERERAGIYPGGKENRFIREAWFGGLILFWVRRAWKAGFRKSALRLAFRTCRMIAAAVLRRSFIRIAGRQPIEAFAFDWTPQANPQPRRLIDR